MMRDGKCDVCGMSNTSILWHDEFTAEEVCRHCLWHNIRELVVPQQCGTGHAAHVALAVTHHRCTPRSPVAP